MIFRAIAILCGFGLLGVAGQSAACSRVGGPPTLEASITDADEIFVAHLDSAAEKTLPVEPGADLNEDDLFEMQGVEGRYTLIEVLKGAPPAKGVVDDLPFGLGNCSLGLMPGWDYVFFVKHDARRPEYRWVGMFSGSFPLGPYRRPGEEEPGLQELKQKINQQTTTPTP